MSDVLKEVTVIVAISVLGMICGFLVFTHTNHGLLEIVIVVIAGLAGFKLKDNIDSKTIKELQELIDSLRNE